MPAAGVFFRVLIARPAPVSVPWGFSNPDAYSEENGCLPAFSGSSDGTRHRYIPAECHGLLSGFQFVRGAASLHHYGYISG